MGKCARTACQSTRAVCWHRSRKELYCPSCARGINETNPGLVMMPAEREIVDMIQDSSFLGFSPQEWRRFVLIELPTTPKDDDWDDLDDDFVRSPECYDAGCQLIWRFARRITNPTPADLVLLMQAIQHAGFGCWSREYWAEGCAEGPKETIYLAYAFCDTPNDAIPWHALINAGIITEEERQERETT